MKNPIAVIEEIAEYLAVHVPHCEHQGSQLREAALLLREEPEGERRIEGFALNSELADEDDSIVIYRIRNEPDWSLRSYSRVTILHGTEGDTG